MPRVRLWAALLLTLVAVGLIDRKGSSQLPPPQFKSGDVFASITPGRVNVYRRDPNTNQFITDPNPGAPFGRLSRREFRLSTGAASFMTGSAFDRDGNFFVTTFVDGGVNGVFRFVRDFNPAVDTPFAFSTGGDAPESIVVDAAGNLYIGHAHGPNDQIRRFSSAGQPVGVPDNLFDAEPDFKQGEGQVGTDWIDLAADQRTMYYTSEGRRIRRFDLETRTQLPDFIDLTPTDTPTATGKLFAIRLLPDGRVLAADNINIKLLSPDQTLSAQDRVLRTYDVPTDPTLGTPDHNNWFSLNLDPDPTSFSFWSGDSATGLIHRFDINSGAMLASIFTGAANQLFGVSVFNEPTQATTPKCETPNIQVSPVTGSTCGTVNLSAKLTCGGNPIAGKTITFSFSVNGSTIQAGQAVTGPDGVASLSDVPSPPQPGTFTGGVTASFAGDDTVADATGSANLVLENGMSLVLQNVTGDTCGTLTFAGTLLCGTAAVPNKSISFSVDGQPVGQATTNANGLATLSGIESEAVPRDSPNAVSASFTGDASFAQASAKSNLVITAGTPTLDVTSTPGDACGSVNVTGKLVCGTRPVSGVPISFALKGETATGTTSATGEATASLTSPLEVGTFPVSASFTGNAVVGAQTGTGSAVISPGTPTLTVQPASGDTCGTLNLSATLVCGARPIQGAPISFALNNQPVQSSTLPTTDASGVASQLNVLSPDVPGDFATGVQAAFAGNAILAPAAATPARLLLLNGTRLVVSDASGSTCSTLDLTATLVCAAKPVGGRSISFLLNGASVGSAITTSSGQATLSPVASPTIAGSFADAIAGAFAGDAGLAGAIDTGNLSLVDGCTPALSLTKTADPTTYTSAGEVITYSYVLKNTGQMPLSSPFTITDDKLGSFACTAQPTLLVGDTLSCQRSYTIKPTDLGTANPPNGVTATINTGIWLAGIMSTQDTSVSGAAGVPDGIYPGWCIQDHVPIDLHNQPAKLYATLGVPLPADVAGIAWNKVNYVLNHKIHAPGKSDLEFFKDVQTAVWVLVGEQNPEFGISATAQQMLNEANAHPDFVPGPGDSLAVIVYSDGMRVTPGSIQESIIEIRPFQTITNHAVATARAGAATVQSNEAQATVRQVLPSAPVGLMDAVAWGHAPGAKPTVSSSTFSTAIGGELLLAFVSADYVNGPNTTVTGVTGGGLAWELVTRANGQKGTAEIWRALAFAPLSSVSVTAALSQSAAASITVVSFKNVEMSGNGPIGAIASNHALSGAPTAVLTTTRNRSWVFVVGTDWDNAVARTPAGSQAVIHQYMPPVGDTFWVQRTSGPVAFAGTSVTMKDLSPANDRWNFAAVEVIPSGTPAALVTVPNGVNRSESEATLWMTSAGLGVGPVNVESSATVPAGSVIRQSPDAGTQVAGGSMVELIVSSGPPVRRPEVDQVVSQNGSGRVTTPSFSTSRPGELLVALVASDGPRSGRQWVTIAGAALAWTLVQRANSQSGSSEIWQAYAAAPLSNVTVSSTERSGSYHQSLTVVAFTGASGVGASGIAGGRSGAPSASLITTSAGSLVYGVGNDWDRASARSLATRQVMVHEWVDTGVGDTFWVQSADAPIPAAGTSVRLNATAPTNDQWNLAIVEIVK